MTNYFFRRFLRHYKNNYSLFSLGKWKFFISAWTESLLMRLSYEFFFQSLFILKSKFGQIGLVCPVERLRVNNNSETRTCMNTGFL